MPAIKEDVIVMLASIHNDGNNRRHAYYGTTCMTTYLTYNIHVL